MRFDYQSFLSRLTTRSGVYQMIDQKGQVLYVGKAKNLRKRVKSYFCRRHAHSKTVALVKQIVDIEVIITANEKEAFILENNLIKQLSPRYNILFRDDKSYPYLYLSSDNQYPRLNFYRGSKNKKGRFFGPYPSIASVRQSMALFQKLFKLRQCRDSDFKNRSRPCLQYQIDRCSAPCVGYISAKDYRQDVDYLIMLLEGKSHQVIEALKHKMTGAANTQAYELAAKYRDQIANLQQLQASQHVATDVGDIDVIFVLSELNIICVHMMIIRSGQVLGQQSYFPKTLAQYEGKQIVEAFMGHYYLQQLDHSIPKRILVNLAVSSALASTLSEQAGYKVTMSHMARGHLAGLLKMAAVNAKQAIMTRNTTTLDTLSKLEAVQDLLSLANMPRRIECFDVSHTQGELMVASCVVFGHHGFLKGDYRRFNLVDITPGDDYAAIHQAVFRHYKKIQINNKPLPDLLMIDGGKGQLNQALQALSELQIHGLEILSIAKGPTRKPGLETLFLLGRENNIAFERNNIGLHLLQQIRDEAHRFAITAHRRQRDNKRRTSLVEAIPGVGRKKRQRLLAHFGGLQGVKLASIEDLEKVTGIGKRLADTIYHHYHRPC